MFTVSLPYYFMFQEHRNSRHVVNRNCGMCFCTVVVVY